MDELTDTDLAEFKLRVDRAVAERDAPPAPGEAKTGFFPEDYFSEEDWEALWPVVRGLREAHPEIFNLYGEEPLARVIIVVLSETMTPPTVDELAETLAREARDIDPRLVGTALANVEMDQAIVRLSDEAALIRAGTNPVQDGISDDDEEQFNKVHFGLLEQFGRKLSPPGRWIFGGSARSTDTGRGAAIVSRETGTLVTALAAARAKTLYALSVWAALRPPEAPRELLPDLGIWVPQPRVRTGQRYRDLPVDSRAISPSRGGGIDEWSPYRLPELEDLRTPFEAFSVVRDRRPAQALLSASWALMQASRGSRYVLSERLRHIQVAVEALCEKDEGASYDRKRWESVMDRHGDVAGLSRVYSTAEIQDGIKRLNQARNVAAHGADVVLLDLGYPEGVERTMRGGSVSGDRLGQFGLAADLTPLLAVVRRTLASLWRHMRGSAFDDAEFERQFHP